MTVNIYKEWIREEVKRPQELQAENWYLWTYKDQRNKRVTIFKNLFDVPSNNSCWITIRPLESNKQHLVPVLLIFDGIVYRIENELGLTVKISLNRMKTLEEDLPDRYFKKTN